MRYLPYVFGIFLLTPFVIWAGLSIAMPGPQSGITDAPLTTALLIVSLPLVVYHSMAGLALWPIPWPGVQARPRRSGVQRAS